MGSALGHLTAWSGELRVTISDPPGAPARSVAFFTAGQANPEDAAKALLREYRRWRFDEGNRPLEPGHRDG